MSGHDAYAFFAGMVKVKVVPTPGCDSKVSLPPCLFSMMSRVMAMPSPVPSPMGFVVKKFSKRRSCTSGVMPVPLS